MGIAYQLHYIGGPNNGEIAYATHPYHVVRHPDGAVYRSELQPNGQAVQEWVQDQLRKVTLRFVGYMTGEQFLAEAKPGQPVERLTKRDL